MEHQPPPFFKTGPTPLARLLIFSVLSLALLIADARFSLLPLLRQAVSIVLYPLQRIAAAPAGLARRAGEFFVTHAFLRSENERLLNERLERAAALQQLEALQAENVQLRELLGTRQRLEVKSQLAEVAYTARDPFSRRIVVDRGSQHGVQSGQPVIDHAGVVGQVTRVYPWVAEVTLITDKDHLVPVLNPRNGLRAVLAGTGGNGTLELRFIPLNADFQRGDRLVTSGIDGVYPRGLAVAEVTSVERDAALLFARITCRPLGGVNRNAHVLIVSAGQPVPAPPPEEPKPVRAKKSRKGG
jgi:rod shape-determining protein MreC